MPLDREIAELFAEVREHILYLRELGVEDLRVDLAEESGAWRGRSEPPALAGGQKVGAGPTGGTSQTAIEAGVGEISTNWPAAHAGGSDAPVVGPSVAVPPPGARLAALPSLPKRKTPSLSKSVSDRSASPQDIEMAKANKLVEPVMESAQSANAPTSDKALFGEAGAALPESVETMEEIWADIGNCTRCPLFEGRTQIVQTTGNFNADLMFVGEAPGKNEDAEGEPFVGRAGQLLNKIIEAIGMKRGDVAIGNINRCRPPENRTPTLPEAHTCRPFLLREIAVIKPKVIVVMGNTALHNLLDTKDGITKVRGKFQDYFGVKVMPTFHPAYLLRDPSKKRETWEDMKMVRDYLTSLG